ncbi:MAG: Ig-like domain-containing protein [Flavobacteriaceae bacterium]|nr:Ig-like domain-containing protein [Flavobacteriaceae bacterium]
MTLLHGISCARKGRPGGGPRDITPPILVKSIPDTFSTQVDSKLKTIELEFDEYVILKDYQKNILISPPLDTAPTFSPIGIAAKKVKVELNQELLPETTYTINFGQSIQDNNEGNPYPFFTYVFSTGNYIDSLEIRGSVRNLGERKIPENIIAALYRVDENYHDSLIFSQKPFYVAKLDSAQQFNLKYLHEGEYKLIAFNDETPNMQFDARTEKLAFHSETVQAGSPQHFNLNLFTPEKKYRAVEVVQADYGKLHFIFEGKPEKVDIIPLNHTFTSQRIYHKPFSDTLTYYFNPGKDSITERRPRLRFAIQHQGKTDSIAPVLYDNQKYSALRVNGRSLDYVPGMAYQIESNYPLDSLHKNYISVQKDSLQIDFDIKRINQNRFALEFPIQFEKNYQIRLLPGAVMDLMQRSNDSLQFKFGVKNQRDYGNLILRLQNTPESPYWVKLLDAQNKEIRAEYGRATQFNFKNLRPGEYYFQLIVDENANGRYDSGDFLENRQPEMIYTFPGNVNVRAFWDIEELWVLGGNAMEPVENEDGTTAPRRKTTEELQLIRPTETE